MNQLKQFLTGISQEKQQKQSSYKALQQLIIKNEEEIVSNDLKNMNGSILLNFLSKKCNKPVSNQFYSFLEQFIVQAYQKNHSSFITLVYQLIPGLLTKYIQSVQQKFSSLQNCIKIIYNKEYMHFNINQAQKKILMKQNGVIGSLYRQHFNSQIKAIGQIIDQKKIEPLNQINSSNRIIVKSVLLLTIFNNLEFLAQKTIISYLWMVYVYCGGTEQQEQTGVSLYLLEKKNIFSIFKYYISGQEMSIILLTLYQLSMQRKKNKFELLSAINMIHKKAANQSMFKLSEVAQSTIHLLEDQYSDAFS